MQCVWCVAFLTSDSALASRHAISTRSILVLHRDAKEIVAYQYAKGNKAETEFGMV